MLAVVSNAVVNIVSSASVSVSASFNPLLLLVSCTRMSRTSSRVVSDVVLVRFVTCKHDQINKTTYLYQENLLIEALLQNTACRDKGYVIES